MSVEHRSSIGAKPGATPHARKRGGGLRRWASVIVLAVAGAGGGYYWHQSRDVAPEEQPLIATVTIGDIENTVASSGSLEPRTVVPVGAQVSGLLERLYVDVGDEVVAGQLLAEIDARVQANRVEGTRASIEGQRAQIAAREAALALSQANAERQQRLWEANATSRLELDSSLNNLENARASLTQLKMQIEQSEYSLRTDETQLEFTRIFAPISGTVIAIERNEGETLNASQQSPTILRIADLSLMTVETQVSEADIGEVSPGMEVYFTTLGGRERRWWSTLRQILPTARVDQNVVHYTALFDVPNEDGALLPGMTTQVFFVTSAARNVVTVPLAALTFGNDGANSGGAAARRMTGATGNGGRAPAGRFPGGGTNVPRGELGPGEFSGDVETIRRAFAEGDVQSLRGALRDGFRPDAQWASGDDRGPGARMQARRATVQLVHEDGSIERREVEIGLTSAVAAEVLSGLAPGDRVVAGILEPGTAAPRSSGNDRGGQAIRIGPGGMGGPGGMPGGFFR